MQAEALLVDQEHVRSLYIIAGVPLRRELRIKYEAAALFELVVAQGPRTSYEQRTVRPVQALAGQMVFIKRHGDGLELIFQFLLVLWWHVRLMSAHPHTDKY